MQLPLLDNPRTNALSPEELERYSRQLSLANFSIDAQARLRSTSVLISRSGGVGGTCAMLLARAGIGSLTLAHGGHVLPENLNRMHLANTHDVNRPYVNAFLEKLNDINPNVELKGIPDNINQDNVDDLVSHCDIVADGSPSFEERYLMNQAAIRHQKPMISGAMYDLEGYVTTIVSPRTPCLACIYPHEPASWSTTCFPVIAPIPSLIGSIMAMEVIKLVTGLGETLQGRLWRFDLRSNLAKQFVINKRENCVVCGTRSYASG